MHRACLIFTFSILTSFFIFNTIKWFYFFVSFHGYSDQCKVHTCAFQPSTNITIIYVLICEQIVCTGTSKSNKWQRIVNRRLRMRWSRTQEWKKTQRTKRISKSMAPIEARQSLKKFVQSCLECVHANIYVYNMLYGIQNVEYILEEEMICWKKGNAANWLNSQCNFPNESKKYFSVCSNIMYFMVNINNNNNNNQRAAFHSCVWAFVCGNHSDGIEKKRRRVTQGEWIWKRITCRYLCVNVLCSGPGASVLVLGYYFIILSPAYETQQ